MIASISILHLPLSWTWDNNQSGIRKTIRAKLSGSTKKATKRRKRPSNMQQVLVFWIGKMQIRSDKSHSLSSTKPSPYFAYFWEPRYCVRTLHQSNPGRIYFFGLFRAITSDWPDTSALHATFKVAKKILSQSRLILRSMGGFQCQLLEMGNGKSHPPGPVTFNGR